MTGEYRIPAPRDVVWAGLNDTDILKASIPGCEELVRQSPTELEAKVTAKVGPVKAKFTGQVHLEDLNPPESYTLKGEGKGGPAGFAKGGAKVHLVDEGAATLLTYQAHADIGGKLAQLGSRLVQGTAKKMADDFFANFVAEVSARHGGTADAAEDAVAPAEPAMPVGGAATGAAAGAAAAPAAGTVARPVPAGASAEATRRATARAAGRPFWQLPAVWAAVVAVLVLLLLLL